MALEPHDYSIRFGDQQLLIEHPVRSGIFGAPCGITGLTRQIQTNTNDIDLPPCNDPDAIVWLGVDVTSKRMTLTFSGTLADVALPYWDAWSMEDNPIRRVRWYRNLLGANRGYWEGNAVLTDYSEESSGRGRYTNSGTILFDGKPAYVALPAAATMLTPPRLPEAYPRVGAAFAATPGTYSGTPVLTYQWYRDGQPIAAGTSASYSPIANDIGKRLYLVEIATSGGVSTSTSTLFSDPVRAAA